MNDDSFMVFGQKFQHVTFDWHTQTSIVGKKPSTRNLTQRTKRAIFTFALTAQTVRAFKQQFYVDFETWMSAGTAQNHVNSKQYTCMFAV